MSSHQNTAPATSTRTSAALRPGGLNTGIADRMLAVTAVAAGTGIALTAHRISMRMREGAGIARIAPAAVRRTRSWKKGSACPEKMTTTTILTGEAYAFDESLLLSLSLELTYLFTAVTND